MSPRLIVTIDGPSGAGKSTISKILAAKFNLLYIDTGAMYRCVAWKAKQNNLDPADETGLRQLCDNLEIKFLWTPEGNRVFCHGIEVTDQIRTPEMDMMASAVSKVPAVRQALIQRQRQMGENGRAILEGRDAGTVIFPDAELKIYLDAKLEERAQRRWREQNQRGKDISLTEVLSAIKARDHNDRTRSHSPLTVASDAQIIDTTGMDIETVVQTIGLLIRKINHDGN